MSTIIIKPAHCSEGYIKAADVFRDMYKKVTDIDLSLTDTDDGVSDLVVIGSDAVNRWLLDKMFDGSIPARLGLRYGTDSYIIKSFTVDSRKVLVLAGGRGRSTHYAVYDYFERFADCHYFWDGDIIPHKDTLPMEDININEEPRFEYRGLRYFAHRGLKRYQAEHWSLNDWKQEIDWLIKKRLNFFMLRIGMDDVWQRAFPDTVSYPDGFTKIENYNNYDDRSDFWSLKYRGELREKVLEYARGLDLDYPTDCGTMTHWYSRTPQEFIDKINPKFITDNHYGRSDKTGMVMDFRESENMDIYMKLTETMAETHEKRSDLFHSIGLGERKLFPEDPKKDFNMKLFAYRLIAENLRKRYPNSKLMLASWDFVGWWKPENVQKLMEELDPERTIILDYTSDTNNPDQSFLNWGMVGKFPWIFGLFHAYEPESDLRGCYKRSDERLKVAADDPMCKGMILWPELSHSDPLILEYLTQNAWSPLKKNIEEITADFCQNRYPGLSDEMNECWQLMLPIIQTKDWGGYGTPYKPDDPRYPEICPMWMVHSYLWTHASQVVSRLIELEEQYKPFYKAKTKETITAFPAAIKALRKISEIDKFDNEFVLRDSIDMARTVATRMLDLLLAKAIYSDGNRKLVAQIKEVYMPVLENLADAVSLNSDNSILNTLNELKATAPTNPDFEKTLKRNICCEYCEQSAYELIVGRYIEETNDAFEWLLSDDRNNIARLNPGSYYARFIEKPLESLQPTERPEAIAVFRAIADSVEKALEVLKQ